MIHKGSIRTMVTRRWEVNRFLFALIMLVFSMVMGVSGFMWIEDYRFSEALYMTVITFSTVGFNEVQPLSSDGRIFTSVYIIINLAIIAYVVSVVSAYLFEGELNKLYKRYVFNKGVRKMKDHVIVCGFGRNGSKACEELSEQGLDFVVIDNNEERIEHIEVSYNYKVIMGDATSDEVLLGAGIEKARAIITTLPSDAANVFLSLTARELSKEILIIARASEESSEKKLLRAGATKVIMPDAVGGLHMAQHVTKPVVIEYLDMLSGAGGLDLEEVHVEDLKSEFRDQTIEELNIRKHTGVSVIGFKNEGNKFVFNPGPQVQLSKNTVLIILGQEKEISSFKSKYLS
jgi:voltage-gated potassium channel